MSASFESETTENASIQNDFASIGRNDASIHDKTALIGKLKNDEKAGILEKVFPPKPIDQELNTITEFAIAHNIKGVIPKEILELYRTEMPIFATLIDNYGVRIPDESEMFRIPYLDEKDKQDDVKSEDIQRDVSDADDDIDI